MASRTAGPAPIRPQPVPLQPGSRGAFGLPGGEARGDAAEVRRTSIMVRRASTPCAPAVRPGRSYSASSWYRANGTARWVLYLHNTSTDRWVRWRHGGTLPARTRWTRTRFATPVVPAWADRMSIGIALRSTGKLVVDDFALTARSRPAPTRHRQWFVSRSGDGSDGRSWGTAWRDFAAIAWAGVRPGDEIVVDGGKTPCPSGYDFADHGAHRPGLSCGMQYTTALRPGASGAPGLPITVTLSKEPGRNGTVVLFGGRSTMLPACNQQSYQQSGSAIRPAWWFLAGPTSSSTAGIAAASWSTGRPLVSISTATPPIT